MVRNLVIVLKNVLLIATAACIANLVFKELCQTVRRPAFIVITRIIFEQIFKDELANIFDLVPVLAV